MTGRRDQLQKLIFTSALGCAIFLSTSAVAQTYKAVVQADISHIADTSHIEFKGLKNWRYEVQKNGPKKITLSVPAFDEASVARLKSFSDALVDQVSVDKNGADGTYVVTFKLAQSEVESFDYLTDEPSRLIIDFYRKTEPAAKKTQSAEAKKKAAAKAVAKRKARAKAKQAKNSEGYRDVPGAQRKPAGDEFLSADAESSDKSDTKLHFGIFDGGDDNYDRFRIKDYEISENSIIASRQNVYLPFPMLKMKLSLLDKLMEQQPEYVIHPKETRENKEARLLLTLFKRKRFAVYLKTYDYFMNKYADSPYAEILKNITAHVYLERWKKSGRSVEFDEARSIFGELVQKYPASPLREQNYLILGFMQMERGDALSTLQTFEGFLKAYPTSPEIPTVRKAVAEAYMILQKYDEALAEYNAIIKNYPKTEHAEEARYRIGDVYFAKSDYTQAIRSYEAAIKELPAQEKVFPNADFNMAEARFWQKDFKKSLSNYVQFVNLFPTNEYGGYALTRIGELLGVLGADQRRVMGAFLESYFPLSQSSGSEGRPHPHAQSTNEGHETERDEKSRRRNRRDFGWSRPAGNQRIHLFDVGRGFVASGEFNAAINNLIAYYQKNPTSANLGSFRSRILRNIANELKDKVDHGETMQALAFYSKFANTWLKNTDRIDIPFFVGGAYERAGAYGEAQKIYREALQNRLHIAGTESEKRKKVQEHLPSVATLHLRLASVLAEDRNYMEAHQELKAIAANAELSPAETVERVQLSALIAEQRNDPQRAREALQELAQKWKGDPALVAPVHLKLAQIFNKLGDFKQAEAHADKVCNPKAVKPRSLTERWPTR